MKKNVDVQKKYFQEFFQFILREIANKTEY